MSPMESGIRVIRVQSRRASWLFRLGPLLYVREYLIQILSRQIPSVLDDGIDLGRVRNIRKRIGVEQYQIRDLSFFNSSLAR